MGYVLKWELAPGQASLLLPPGARALSAKPQFGGSVVLYTLSDTMDASRQVGTIAVPTGTCFLLPLDYEFVDTVDLNGLFFHVFVQNLHLDGLVW